MATWLRNERIDFSLALIIGVVIGSNPVIIIPILENEGEYYTTLGLVTVHYRGRLKSTQPGASAASTARMLLRKLVDEEAGFWGSYVERLPEPLARELGRHDHGNHEPRPPVADEGPEPEFREDQDDHADRE
jgi:hypothetical protein